MLADLLKFVRVKAVWENVPKNILAAVSEWVAKNQLKKQVYVDEAKSKVFVGCEIGPEPDKELAPAVSIPLPNLPDPTWFRISISEAELKGPAIAVVNHGGELLGGAFLRESPNGERMMIHPFLDGIVVRRWKVRDGSHVDAHRLSVSHVGGRYLLAVSPRLDVFIPDYSSESDLEASFQDSHVPENLQDIVAAMVGFGHSDRDYNPDWDGPLAELHKKQEPENSRLVVETDVVDSGKRRSKKERRHKEEGSKPKPETPEEMPRIPVGASLQDVLEQQEVVEE